MKTVVFALPCDIQSNTRSVKVVYSVSGAYKQGRYEKMVEKFACNVQRYSFYHARRAEGRTN